MIMRIASRARVGVLVAALGAAACAPAAAPPSASAPPAKPAAPSAPAQPAAQSAPPAAVAPAPPAAAPAAGATAARPDPAEWERVKTAARQEGRVVVSGPPFPGFRSAITDAFQQAHGIPVEYISITGAELMTRIDRETRAGAVGIDAAIAGNFSCWMMAERGQLEDVRTIMIDPSLHNPAVWRYGEMKFMKPSPGLGRDFSCGLQTSDWVMTDLFVNRDLVPPGAIQSWRDLLKPEYKGKIASFDPRRAGPAHTTVPYLHKMLGSDYLRDLYLGQEVVLLTDNRQLAEQVGRGTYPIGIALVQGAVEPFRAQGLPLERVFPADAPGGLTGGFGLVKKIKSGPNPNAGILFVNWFASHDAQEIYEREVLEYSTRADVSHNVPDYVIPKPGVTYIDTYDPEYYFQQTEGLERLQALLGR
jgi:iron(III) transport system substrate-binding protein